MSDRTGDQTPEQGSDKSTPGLSQSKRRNPKAEADSVSTTLALDRNFLAAERTLMGWIRTSLSMITFGFTIGKLGEVLKGVEVKGLAGRSMSVERLASYLVILGTVALLGAAVQHVVRVRRLRAMGLRRQLSITFVVAVVLVALGGFALSSLVLAL